MALLLNSRFDAGFSDIPWDGDASYPFTTGCYGRPSKFFPPTSSTEGNRRTGFNGPTGSSVTTQMQRLLASKKSVNFTVTGRESRERVQTS